MIDKLFLVAVFSLNMAHGLDEWISARVVSPPRLVRHSGPATAPTSGMGDDSESQRKFRHELGFTTLVFRDRIQQELRLTAAQRERLDAYLRANVPEAMQFFQGLETAPADARDQQLQSYRQKALEKLDLALRSILDKDQIRRLGELVRQREGLFGGPTIWKDLDITAAQQAQFATVVPPMNMKMQALVAQAYRTGDPARIQRQVLELRAELEAKMEEVLSDAQRTRWKSMLGKPIDRSALFDLTPD